MKILETLPVLEEGVDVLDGEGQQLAHRLGVGVEDDRLVVKLILSILQ